MSEYGVHLSEYGLHLHVTRSGFGGTSTRVQFSDPRPADRRPGSGTRTREPRVRSRASGVGAGSLEVPPARRRSRDLLRYYRINLRGPPDVPGGPVACGDTGHNGTIRIRAITPARDTPVTAFRVGPLAWWSEVIR